MPGKNGAGPTESHAINLWHYPRPICFFVLPFYQTIKIRQTADKTTKPKASGVSTFQQSCISWSTRRRGYVQRIATCINNKTAVLLISQNKPQSVPEISPGVPLVKSASLRLPMLGKTVFQLPKNKTTATRQTSNIMAYSAKNKAANRKPLYST